MYVNENKRDFDKSLLSKDSIDSKDIQEYNEFKKSIKPYNSLANNSAASTDNKKIYTRASESS